jgi:2-succinyl-5-enolpyruvyl-6-hydroxy-3-cyclohexene-1-carboxylate synthase
MTDIGSINLHWAFALLDGLVAGGLRCVVISPGSRSTPLALACRAHPAVRTWVQVDERSAGFFALGLALADRAPVGLVCTSGTAPAHWYPAVIEASQAGVPLVLLSADRPPELQDCGANQTIDQTRLFGTHTRAFHALGTADASERGLDYAYATGRKAACRARHPLPGPVHINVPLREPLVPSGKMPELVPRPAPNPPPSTAPVPEPKQVERLARAISGRPGLIVCGRGDYAPSFPAALTRLAAVLDCPVVADPLSPMRRGPHDRTRVLAAYDAYLRSESFAAAHRPEWILRFGAVPTSKALGTYLDRHRPDDLFLVDPAGRWLDPSHRATELSAADPKQLCEALTAAAPAKAGPNWLADFLRAEELVHTLKSAPDHAGLPDEAEIIEALTEHLPDGAILFSGNSMAIRDLDTYLTTGAAHLRVVANRGASGIDGNVSTLLGLASASGGPVVGIMGDLAFYHDMNGLLAARGIDTTLIVLNNGGGAIFGYLPQAGLEHFESDWLTPTGLDFEHAAQLYGLRFTRVSHQGEFAPALDKALAHQGPDLIEVMIERNDSLARHRAYWAAVIDRIERETR